MEPKPSSSPQKFSGGPFVCLSSHCEALNLIGNKVHPYASISSQTILGRAISSVRFTTPLPAFIHEALFPVEGSTNEEAPKQLETGVNKVDGMVSNQDQTRMHPHTDFLKITEVLKHHENQSDHVENPFMSTEAVDLSGCSLFPVPSPTERHFSADSQAVLLAFEQDFGIAPYWSAFNYTGQADTTAEENAPNHIEYGAFTSPIPGTRHLNSALPKTSPLSALPDSSSIEENQVQYAQDPTVAASISPLNIQNNAFNGQLVLHTLAQALLILQLPGRSPVASFQLHQYRPCIVNLKEVDGALEKAFHYDVHFSIRPRDNCGSVSENARSDTASTASNVANCTERHFIFDMSLEVKTPQRRSGADDVLVSSSATSGRKRVKTETGAGMAICQCVPSSKDDPSIALRCTFAFPTPIVGCCWLAGVSAPQAGRVFEHAETFFHEPQGPSQAASETKLQAAIKWETIITNTLIPRFFPMCWEGHESTVGVTPSQQARSELPSSRLGTPHNPKQSVGLAQKHSFEFLRCLAHLSWCMDVMGVVERAWQGSHQRGSPSETESRGRGSGKELCAIRGAVLLVMPDHITVEQSGGPWSSILLLVKSKENIAQQSPDGTPERGKGSVHQHGISMLSEKEGLIECSLADIYRTLLSLSESFSDTTVVESGGFNGVVVRATGCGSESGQLEWKAFGGLLGAAKLEGSGVLSGKLKDFCRFIGTS